MYSNLYKEIDRENVASCWLYFRDELHTFKCTKCYDFGHEM